MSQSYSYNEKQMQSTLSEYYTLFQMLDLIERNRWSYYLYHQSCCKWVSGVWGLNSRYEMSTDEERQTKTQISV
jgi:hypothetical protein